MLRLKLTWLLVLLVPPLAAQRMVEHGESSWSEQLWPNSVAMGDDRTAARQPAGSISAELLRYPLSAKAAHMLQKALRMSESGDHAGAIQQLQKTLAKCDGSGAYVYSLLGVEYLKTEQIPEAVDVLEQAVKLLPHDASNHANLGLALVADGQYDRAEPELKRALELDPHYAMASRLLSALAIAKHR